MLFGSLFAKFHLAVILLNAILVIFIMLNVFVLNVIMLSVILQKIIMKYVISLNAIVLNVILCYVEQWVETNPSNICICPTDIRFAAWLYYADSVDMNVKYRCLRMLDWLVSTTPPMWRLSVIMQNVVAPKT